MKNSIVRSEIDALLASSEIDVCTKFGKVTVVTVKLPNGFVLVEASGAVSQENYSEETGRKVCLDRIAQQLWSFEGYRLSTEIANRGPLQALARELSALSYLIEKLPASERQTEISVAASEIFSRLSALSA